MIIDVGTGDGLFVYRCARQNPNKFYIGIDANPRPLAKISEKIRRRPSKGGSPNVLFIQCSVEDLPSELNAVAREVHIHFPWGSLLRAVATGDKVVLENLRRVCSSEALLKVIMGLDPDRDRSEMERLDLPPISLAYISSVLVPNYAAAGFQILEKVMLPVSEWPKLQTSWAKRLKRNVSRSIISIIARAAEIKHSKP